MNEKLSKYEGMRRLQQSVGEQRGLSFVADEALMEKHLQSDIDTALVEAFEGSHQEGLCLDVSEEEIAQKIADTVASLRESLGREPRPYELHRALSVQAFRIDSIMDYEELLWDPKARRCDKDSALITNILSRTMFGPLRSFEILRLKNGTGPSVICINGFLTKDDSEGDDWQKAISESPYANSPIHLVRWDSSSPKEIFSGVFSVEILRKGFKLAAASAIAGAGLGLAIAPPLGGGVGTAGGGAAAMAIRPVKCWYDAMAKTEKVADMLSYIFQCTNNDKGYVLMGHSLGARVIHYLLRDLLKHRTVLIKDVFLLGGAVGRTGWPRADEIVEGTIYNCFSQDDKVLQCLYKGATLFHDEPIGLGNVEPSGIATDLDARELADVRGHTEHKGKFSKILAQL